MDAQRELHRRRIQEALQQIDHFLAGGANAHSSEFGAWRERTEQSLEVLFGPDHDYKTRFRHLRFWLARTSIGPERRPTWIAKDQEQFETGLARARHLLRDALEELEVVGAAPGAAPAEQPLPLAPPVPADFDQSVFLNCPFDDQFAPLREAAVFTLVLLGFHVRSALDTADGSRVRIEKLYDLIRSSRLGIHDLSRTGLDDEHGLPRFNMPLELGIFLGVKDAGGAVQRRKVASA